MRKFGLVLSLAAAAVAGTACNTTGFDGSWTPQFFPGSDYTAGNNAGNSATLPSQMVAVTGDGSATWWHPESHSRYNGCDPQIIVQLYAQMNNPANFGLVFDLGEYAAHAVGSVYSSVRDTNGDGRISGPTDDQINVLTGGYSSGVAYGNYCNDGGAGGPFGTGSFDDEMVARQITPLGGYYSTGVTDNLSIFMQPVTANDTRLKEANLNLNGGLDRLPLATRIEILKTIDVNEDIVRTVGENGYVREDILARLTSVTVDGETFVPSMETSVVIRNFAAAKVDLQNPAFKSVAAWMADRLEAADAAGRQPTWSVTINDSLTLSSQEARSLFPDVAVTRSQQGSVDKLRAYAGTLDRASARRVRFDRRFDETLHADVDFGISKGR